MSLIGTLEQFRLAHVLQRVEAHEKTGLLVVKQGPYWVEFYFRDGRLLCVGPLRTRATLGERLVREGLISQQVLLDIKLTLNDAEQSETRVALALMEGNYVSREDLRAWTIRKTTDALGAILSWASGEVYFEDNTPPPADRLLVSMSVTSIIDAIPQSTAPSQPVSSVQPPEQPSWAGQSPSMVGYAAAPAVTPTPANRLASSPAHPPLSIPTPPIPSSTPPAAIDRVPTLTGASQFLSEKVGEARKNESFAQFLNDKVSEPLPPTGAADGFLNDAGPASNMQVADAAGFLSAASLIGSFPSGVLPATESLSSLLPAPDTEDFSFSGTGASDVSFAGLTSPETPAPVLSSVVAIPVMQPVPPRRIDTSFMQPDMLLYPTDLSAFRDQNPQVQVTPDQWRLLMCVDGQTSLQAACHVLGIPPEVVCQLAGELLAEGLIQVTLPQMSPADAVSQAHEQVVGGMGNTYVAPGYAAIPAAPWSASVPVLPTSDVAPQYAPALPFETESQWGNGGNGATFVPGRGWVTTPQPLQPLQSGEQMPPSSSSNLAYAGAGNGGY